MCIKLQTVVKKNTAMAVTSLQGHKSTWGGGGGGGGSLARGTSGSPAAQPCGHGDEPRLSHF